MITTMSGLSCTSWARTSTVRSSLTSWRTWVSATPTRAANWTRRIRRKQVQLHWRCFTIANKVETTNRCEALKYFNILKMCPKSKYLLVAHLPVGLPNIWSIKFTLNIFTYLCFENLIPNIDLLCYYVNLIL